MAFDWGGTFNRSQFERFVTFAQGQRGAVAARIAHLEAEAARVGVLAFGYNSDGSPFGLSAEPTTYIGKLLSVYEVLGGDPQRDLQVRSKAQPVYIVKGSESGSPQAMSSGAVIGGKGLGDADSANLMQDARSWLEEVLHYRRDYLERKIRRALDYVDELQREILILRGIGAAVDVSTSLDYIFSQVNQLLSDKNYRPIYDDKGRDVDGLNSHAQVSSYELGEGRVGESIQRGEGGVTMPGETQG